MTGWPLRIAEHLRTSAGRRAGETLRVEGYLVPLPAGPWPMGAVPGPSWRRRADDLQAAIDLQRAHDLPPSVEWVDEACPMLAGLISSHPRLGLSVSRHPLLVCEDPRLLRSGRIGPVGPRAAVLDVVGVDDPDRGEVLRVPAVAFATDDAALPDTPADVLAFHAERLRAGVSLTAAARIDAIGPVSVGSLQLEADGAEIVGLGTLPGWRGRGLGSAVCAFLAGAAFDRGASFVYLSATDDRVADLYTRIGFRRVGVFCSAA